ncbi:MAG: DUF1552 domain-containing protein, partial [Proteobacteria bacterium]
LPFLEAMMSNTAFGATPQKKFISFFSGCGVTPETFYPTGSEADFKFSQSLKPLEAYRKRLLVFDGITNDSANNPKYGGHQGSHVGMISGQPFVVSNITANDDYEKMRPTGISLDQRIADKIAMTSKARFKSIQLGILNGIEGNPFDQCASFTGPNMLLRPEGDPQKAFEMLFKDAAVASQDSTAGELLKSRRKSVLDFVMDRTMALNARLGAEDKARVDQHLTSIREIEMQLTGSTSSGCMIPEAPKKVGAATLATYAKLQFDLMIAALACDMTHVASMTWFGTRGGNFNYAQVIPKTTIEIKGAHHGLSHDKAATPQITAINAYIASQMGYMMTKLESYKDASGGSLVDSTLILWWNELGFSNEGHKSSPSPFVLGGGAAGALKMGRFLDFTKKKQSNNNLLLSVYNVVTDSKDTTIGDPKYCTGVLPGFV